MLVPDYYPEFHCKMGKCRHTCCFGWPISVSMQDYFRLLGLECKESLRRKLDVSLHLFEHPTEERYAQLCPGYDGNCTMILPDGRCALHAELGTSAFPSICRLYPRRIQHGECSCTNSCEAVLEMFLHREKPIEFCRMEPSEAEGLSADWESRYSLLRCLQNRTLSLPDRIRAIASLQKEVTSERGVELAMDLVKAVVEKSPSVSPYGTAALQWFRTQGRHSETATHFAEQLPQWEVVFEHMLVNHLFFMGACERADTTLIAIYALLRLLCLGWMAEHTGEDQFIDVCAATFRFVAHTSFEGFAEHFLKDTTPAERDALLWV